MKRQDNSSCPSPSHKNRCLVEKSDRERRVCKDIGCRYYGVPMSRLDRHIRKVHPDTMKPMDKQANADCSFSSDEDVEDISLKAKIEEIIASLL